MPRFTHIEPVVGQIECLKGHSSERIPTFLPIKNVQMSHVCEEHCRLESLYLVTKQVEILQTGQSNKSLRFQLKADVEPEHQPPQSALTAEGVVSDHKRHILPSEVQLLQLLQPRQGGGVNLRDVVHLQEQVGDVRRNRRDPAQVLGATRQTPLSLSPGWRGGRTDKERSDFSFKNSPLHHGISHRMVMEEGGQRDRGRGTPVAETEGRHILVELGEQNLDAIVLSTYRTACKIRFIQKRCNLHLIDIYNVIEAVRDAGLNAVELNAGISVTRLENLVFSLFNQLSKRLPTTHNINQRESAVLLVEFLLAAIDSEPDSRLTVLSVKAMLAILCGGKLVSDSNGVLVLSKFDSFLREALKLPTAAHEGPRVMLNMFLDIVNDPPPCLVWLPLLHRMANVEHVHHPVSCSYCRGNGMTGFRYRCLRCRGYQLCQNCFWHGNASSSHSNQHQMKEHSSWKSSATKLGRALSRTLGCGSSREPPHPIYPEEPEQTLNLSNIVPCRPIGNTSEAMLLSSQVPESSKSLAAAQRMNEEHALIAAYVNRLQSPSSADSPSRADEEHKLIARYTSRLAENDSAAVIPNRSINFDVNKQKRNSLLSWSAKTEILAEIKSLRVEHDAACQASPEIGGSNPTLLAELRLLRQRKDELEQRMSSLQESRRELMVQLEGLMKLLKAQAAGSSHASPSRPSPSTVRSVAAASPHAHILTRWGGRDVQEAFAQGPRRNLRNDLLVAADSITNTVSSLVKELHSDDVREEEERLLNGKDRVLFLTRREHFLNFWQRPVALDLAPHKHLLTNFLSLFSRIKRSQDKQKHLSVYVYGPAEMISFNGMLPAVG
ncbi:hypothetical protein F7725_019872 [Dissostichus mawsoni]|uniref:ZZ-type domain-containing protein n=1 Tax=Dissostichus mawsoni TaxID=36200 RepID=A0A7J5YLV8_DISMA|nr:hypothetical protein F7725_019872 [Dissostichus mawsoni]